MMNCHQVQLQQEVYREQKHTSIKDEFQFNQLHIDQFRADLFMRNTQSNMLNFDEVSLKRVV
jgi:hypothetical protein